MDNDKRKMTSPNFYGIPVVSWEKADKIADLSWQISDELGMSEDLVSDGIQQVMKQCLYDEYVKKYGYILNALTGSDTGE